MIIDHTHLFYRRKWCLAGAARFNGAYYYSKEIVENIIPKIKTDRNWVTINIPGAGLDHSIVFIHNNIRPDYYDWLSKYEDLILVCGVPETCDKVAHLGTPIYIPLSIDVEFVESFKTEKTKYTAYAGRANKKKGNIPEGVDLLEDLERSQLLAKMAEYEKIYAVGRTAIEAKALGCEVLPYDPRYPDPELWEVVDNKDVVELLQEKIDEIDKAEKKPRKKKKTKKVEEDFESM